MFIPLFYVSKSTFEIQTYFSCNFLCLNPHNLESDILFGLFCMSESSFLHFRHKMLLLHYVGKALFYFQT